MLKRIKNKKNILFSIIMMFICFFAYQYWVGAAESDYQLISIKDAASGDVGNETLQLLSELRTLVLDEDIFTDRTFQNLEDFSVELQPQPIGRNNPFAPIGADGIYTSVEIGTSTDQNQ